MADSNIKGKVFSNAIWKFAERVIAQMITLIVSVIIARILNPDDYSVVSVVTIFFSFSNILISGGLNTALIQKKDADEIDYSTVFHVSIILSVSVYAILFFMAPTIAELYGIELLTPIFRVMSLILPINAVKSIYCAYISSRLEFRKFFFSTLGGTIFSAIIGIYMALHGYGAWALVFQQMSNTLIDTTILIIVTRLPLRFLISKDRLKGLFQYGWKILATSFLNTVYNEISPLFVGLRYSATDLSFYTKGKSFPNLLSSTSTYTLSAVLFPVLAKYQDDKEIILKLTRRYMRVVSFIIFPLMFGFFAVSDNFIKVILTDKWMPASIYIKIFCVAMMFDVVTVGNCETIKAIGRSDVFLVIEIIKKTCYFIVIGLFMVFTNTPQALAISAIVCNLIALTVNSIPNVKLIGYKITFLLQDLAPNFCTAAVMCIMVNVLGFLKINEIVLLLLQIISGGICYIVINAIIKNDSLIYLFGIIKEMVSGKNKE